MPSSTNLEDFERAWIEDRIDDARAILFRLTERERAELEAELGSEVLAQTLRAARRRRGRRRGRVIVVNGIMGATLDVAKGRARDKVWIDAWQLAKGRMADLALKSDGKSPAQAGVSVGLRGLHKKTYLPLVFELDTQWQVAKFPFDWRLDIASAAERLAEFAAEWGRGEPVHLVAHSMGGLVARLFTKRFPRVWRALQDPSSAGRGGRLVMLGTPNRGSFAIPQVATGSEAVVRKLALVDLVHSKRALLKIVNSFPGSFQMLPSPAVELGDDHAALYRAESWAAGSVPQAMLDRARRFHAELEELVDAERLVYVAGCDQETPARIRVRAPGDFEYRVSSDGDGRVTHELGVLEGVATYWIHEAHGDLPRNERVLGAIHELLASGQSAALPSERPPSRGLARAGAWVAGEALEPLPADFAAAAGQLAKAAARSGGRAPERLLARRVESLIAEGPLASGSARAPGAAAARRPARAAPGKRPKLAVEVVCGDITKLEGDVYCVGHYQGVLPINAELALDKVVSYKRAELARPASSLDPERLVLTELTRRSILRGELGDVDLYPWADPADRKKSVAVAGMGHPGSFREGSLRQLARSLAWTVGSLPGSSRILTILIGSGMGGLSVESAVRGFMAGLGEAVASGLRGGVSKVSIVEIDLAKAQRLQVALAQVVAREERVRFVLAPAIVEHESAWIPDRLAWALVLAAAARGSAQRKDSAAHRAARALVARLPSRGHRRRRAWQALEHLGGLAGEIEALAGRLDVDVVEPPRAASDRPARISFTRQGNRVRAAAINDSAVVPEREVADLALVRELAELTREPEPEALEDLAKLVYRRMIPADFRNTIDIESPKVFEVDRDLAELHWEVMAFEPEAAHEPFHLGLRSSVARQLRTAYSPPPEPVPEPDTPLRALVIGDPGDPAEGFDLPGARREAEAVARRLAAAGIETVRRIGAPEGRHSSFSGAQGPASRLEILRLLDESQFDLLHYAGHGDFDPEDPSRTGWVFKDGLLTAHDLASVGQRLPRLVVANACLSARTSLALAGGARARGGAELGLLPSLADQFLRQGVHNYVGTAWEVDDDGAVLFAETLYGHLFEGRRDARRAGDSAELGAALLAARRALAAELVRFGSLWLAYQHYGSPLFRL